MVTVYEVYMGYFCFVNNGLPLSKLFNVVDIVINIYWYRLNAHSNYMVIFASLDFYYKKGVSSVKLNDHA